MTLTSERPPDRGGDPGAAVPPLDPAPVPPLDPAPVLDPAPSPSTTPSARTAGSPPPAAGDPAGTRTVPPSPSSGQPGGTPPSGGRATGQRPQGPTPPPRPGLREQFGRTRSAFGGLISAHRALFQAELAEIMGEVKVIAMLAGAILGLALLLTTLLYTGTWLFLGEWLFGSIGWGLLHGALFTIALIAVLGLQIVADSPRPGLLGFGAAVVVGVVLSLLLGSNVLRGTSEWLGEQAASILRLDPAAFAGRHVTFIVMAVILGILGLLLGLRAGARGAIGGLVAGLILGALWGFALGGDDLGRAYPIIAAAVTYGVILGVIGLILGGMRAGGSGAYLGFVGGALLGVIAGSLAGAITYDNKGAVAIAVTIALVAWPVFAVMFAMRAGLDPSARFGRLVPRQSINAVNETKSWLEQEWQRQRTKLTSR